MFDASQPPPSALIKGRQTAGKAADFPRARHARRGYARLTAVRLLATLKSGARYAQTTNGIERRGLGRLRRLVEDARDRISRRCDLRLRACTGSPLPRSASGRVEGALRQPLHQALFRARSN